VGARKRMAKSEIAAGHKWPRVVSSPDVKDAAGW